MFCLKYLFLIEEFHGYENTYIFIQNGRKKIIHPMKEVSPVRKPKEEQPKKVLSMCQFECFTN